MTLITITTTPQDLPIGTASILCRQRTDSTSRVIITDKNSGLDILDYYNYEIYKNKSIELSESQTYSIRCDLVDGLDWQFIALSSVGGVI